MLRKFALCAVVFAGLVANGAGADESSIRKAVAAKFPKMTIESIGKTPFPGIFEVVLDGQMFYTDEKSSYLFSGNLLDIRGQQPRNLTQDATNRLAAAVLAKSTDLAVKRVRGNGKRVIYTFEDPNCGFCKELQKELVKLNDVTIYTFLWPILSQDSIDKSKAIWCSRDRAKAWDDFMLKGIAPAGKRDCDTPLDQNARLAQRFGLRGTPGVYIANGDRIGGFLAADKIEAALSAAR